MFQSKWSDSQKYGTLNNENIETLRNVYED